MLMETAVLQGKNYEVYLKWAKWLMIMGCVCVILNLLLWKFLEWSWLMSEYDAGARYIIFRPYSIMIVTMSHILSLTAAFVLRKYPNIVYRTFATRLIIAWCIAILFFWGRDYVMNLSIGISDLFRYIVFIPSIFFVWAYSTLLEDGRMKYASTWVVCLFFVSVTDLISTFANLDYQSFSYHSSSHLQVAAIVLFGAIIVANIVYILLWKSLLSIPTDIEIDLSGKKVSRVNRVVIGYVIVSLIYFIAYVFIRFYFID